MPGKFTSRTSWREKLEHPKPKLPKIVPIPPKMATRLGRGTLVIPHPLQVDALIRKVRRGKLVTQTRIRQALARRCKATMACPITTGIFVRIAAEAAEEDRRAGRRTITPYWRVVRDDGSLIEKFPGGVNRQAARLRIEGHRITPGLGRRPPRVEKNEAALALLK